MDERLLKLRHKIQLHKLNVVEVANRSGVTKSTIYRWLVEDSAPRGPDGFNAVMDTVDEMVRWCVVLAETKAGPNFYASYSVDLIHSYVGYPSAGVTIKVLGWYDRRDEAVARVKVERKRLQRVVPIGRDGLTVRGTPPPDSQTGAVSPSSHRPSPPPVVIA